jgi:hypothetical protein
MGSGVSVVKLFLIDRLLVIMEDDSLLLSVNLRQGTSLMQPPQNPYSGFPGPNDPLPPSGGSVGPSYPPGMPPRGPEISFDAISQAWAAIQPHLGVYIGAAAVVMFVSVASNILQLALTPPAANGQQTLSLVPLAVAFVGALINLFFHCGFIRMAINHLRTGTPNFGDMFSVGDVYLSSFAAFILICIATFLGGCLCLIPGLLLAALFMFTFPLIVDRRMGPIEAMGASFEALKPQMWMALLYGIVVYILMFAGVAACFIGLLITFPLGIMTLAVTYRNFFDNGASPSFGGHIPPTAPIADPRM